MAPRANWKGYLKLSLVSCPVALYPATSEREKVSFHQLSSKTGNRVRKHIVKSKAGHFSPDSFRDRYQRAVKDLLKRKQAGETIEAPSEPHTAKVFNLMDALRASIGVEGKKGPAPSRRKRSGGQGTRKRARGTSKRKKAA
jgi:non-homologous end joining protein Ku